MLRGFMPEYLSEIIIYNNNILQAGKSKEKQFCQRKKKKSNLPCDGVKESQIELRVCCIILLLFELLL